jgi:hypothetical protein
MPGVEAPDPVMDPFVRIFGIPATSPWDQDRAAKLDAVLNSPLAESDVAICVRRLGLWSPSDSSRYCAAYLRKSQISDEHRVIRLIEGRDIEFVFRSDRFVRARRARRMTDLALTVAACAAVLLASVKAIEARGDNVLALSGVEHGLRESLARQAEQDRESRFSQELAGASSQGRGGDNLMADLAWIARSRRADVQIDAVLWNGGTITLRTADQSNPIAGAERQVEQVDTADGDVWRVAPRPHALVTSPLDRPPSIVFRGSPAATVQRDPR